ncbi:MAG: hypothetical protein RLZZ211_2090 [Bacteroidota bacterium]
MTKLLLAFLLSLIVQSSYAQRVVYYQLSECDMKRAEELSSANFLISKQTINDTLLLQLGLVRNCEFQTSPKLSMRHDTLFVELENSSERYAACECYFELTIRSVGITDSAFKGIFSNQNKGLVEFKPYPSQFIDPENNDKNRK